VKQYLQLLQDIMDHGEDRDDRTGVGTRSLSGYQMRFDLTEGFPLLTTKKLYTKAIFTELLWMLAGETDNNWLNDRGVTIWDEWATKDQTSRFGRLVGDLGPTYGHQWRNFGGFEGQHLRNLGTDQISRVVKDLQENPYSRRHIVSAWNPEDADKVALPPCHTMFQFYVHTNGRLDCHMYQRSADTFLGVPYNIASYALLTHMMAQVCGLSPGAFVHSFGDVHLYRNHFEQVELQLSRTPKELPFLVLNPKISRLEDFNLGDITVLDYHPDPSIAAPVAV